jgi:hypothetical protein
MNKGVAAAILSSNLERRGKPSFVQITTVSYKVTFITLRTSANKPGVNYRRVTDFRGEKTEPLHNSAALEAKIQSQ